MFEWKGGIGRLRLLDWLPFGRVAEISPDELAARLQAGERLLVLDVRTALEYRRGHIAGAIHVPVQSLATALPHLEPAHLDRDRHVPVVAVCKTAHRSIPAVRLLRERGLQAAQLTGGMDLWRRLGHPVRRG